MTLRWAHLGGSGLAVLRLPLVSGLHVASTTELVTTERGVSFSKATSR